MVKYLRSCVESNCPSSSFHCERIFEFETLEFAGTDFVGCALSFQLSSYSTSGMMSL